MTACGVAVKKRAGQVMKAALLEFGGRDLRACFSCYGSSRGKILQALPFRSLLQAVCPSIRIPMLRHIVVSDRALEQGIYVDAWFYNAGKILNVPG